MATLSLCPKCEDRRHVCDPEGNWVRCECLLTYEVKKRMGRFSETSILETVSPFQKYFNQNAFFRGTSGSDQGVSCLAKMRSHVARILQDTEASTPCVEVLAYDLVNMYFDDSDKIKARLRNLYRPPWVLLLLGEGSEVGNKLLSELVEGLLTGRTIPRFTWVYTRRPDAYIMERYGQNVWHLLASMSKGTVSS